MAIFEKEDNIQNSTRQRIAVIYIFHFSYTAWLTVNLHMIFEKLSITNPALINGVWAATAIAVLWQIISLVASLLG